MSTERETPSAGTPGETPQTPPVEDGPEEWMESLSRFFSREGIYQPTREEQEAATWLSQCKLRRRYRRARRLQLLCQALRDPVQLLLLKRKHRG